MCAVVVAAVAAYASYEHQRTFALRGGADAAGASLWPLSVDGLLLLATVGLLKSSERSSRRTRYVVRLAFFMGIAVSLAANVAAAPRPQWQPVLVAGWPPVALLLAVELLAHGPGGRERSESVGVAVRSKGEPERDRAAVRDRSAEPVGGESADRESRTVSVSLRRRPGSAEQVMWDHLQHRLAEGRMPTGAELDRVAGTNNYGRAVLTRWRRSGRIPAAPVPAPDPGSGGGAVGQR